MKKLILLFTMVCATNQLYGMEQATPKETLLPDLKQKITHMASSASKNLNEAINALESASTFYGVQFDKLFFDNLKDFTALVNLLAKKFPDKSRKEIAEKFKTPIAKKYVHLGEKLANNWKKKDILTQLIKEGVDLYYSITYATDEGVYLLTPLNRATMSKNVEIVQLLLDAGANPNYKDSLGKTAFEYIDKHASDNKTQKIRQMLDEAMNK